MFDLIMKYFKIKAKSIPEFVSVLKKEDCQSVAVIPRKTMKDYHYSAAVGNLGTFEYILEYTSLTPRGRKVVYREKHSERFGSDRGFADADDSGKAAINLFLFGEKKVMELREMLPKVSVDLIGPNGRPMDDKMYAQLHQDAAAISATESVERRDGNI